jgi:hypothetical protein
MYNGEVDVMNIRFAELREVITEFIVIEGMTTFTGRSKTLRFERDAKINGWDLSNVRYHPFNPPLLSPETSPWDIERAQRNHVVNVIDHLRDSDLILISDADEIPTASSIRTCLSSDNENLWGFEMFTSYFRLNYVMVEPKVLAKSIWTIGVNQKALKIWTADQLRHGIRSRDIPSEIVQDGGWHFSYLMDNAGIRKKLASFSHQELNTRAIRKSINIDKLISGSKDLFSRDGYTWRIEEIDILPKYVQDNLDIFEKWVVHNLPIDDRPGKHIQNK